MVGGKEVRQKQSSQEASGPCLLSSWTEGAAALPGAPEDTEQGRPVPVGIAAQQCAGCPLPIQCLYSN